MMWRTFIAVVCVTVLPCWAVGPHADEVKLSENDTVESLSAVLKEKPRKDRLVAIRKLGMIDGEASRAALMEHYKYLPQAKPSTGAGQPEKIAVVEELSRKLESSERRIFLLEVLEKEIGALREAKKIEQDAYYPEKLSYAVLRLLKIQGITEELRDKLSQYGTDKSIPSSARSKLLEVVLDFDMEKDGITSDREKARLVVDNITPRPVASIPWNIYKNPERLIEYGKSKLYQKELDEAGEWLQSDLEVENSAHELLLHRYGVTAVSVIVQALVDQEFDLEKRNYLAMLASDILRKHLERGNTLADDEKSLVNRLRQYVDTMEDKGAFSRRHYAAANLNVVYGKLDIAERIPITPEDRAKMSSVTTKKDKEPQPESATEKQVKESAPLPETKETIKPSEAKKPPVVRTPEQQSVQIAERIDKRMIILAIVVLGLAVVFIGWRVCIDRTKERQ